MKNQCVFMWVLLWVVFISKPLEAIGPRSVTSDGTSVKWASVPITLHLEADLTITKDSQSKDLTSLIQAALNQWVDLSESDVTFTLGSFGSSVDNTNACDVLYDATICPSGPTNDGKNPLVIDEDGSIMARFFGTGNKFKTLGFASIVSSNSSTGAAVRGEAVFNAACLKDFETTGCSSVSGLSSGGFSDDDFTSFIVHEIGHFLGLDHSQVNLTEATDSDTSNNSLINTMFPVFVIGNGANFKTPDRDDQAGLAQLYANSTFSSNTWSMTGTVYNTDGTTGFQCANLVARRTDSSRSNAISALSGEFSSSSTNGRYEISGLSPGVSYTIDVEPISSSATGASGYTPCLTSPPQFTKFTSSGSFTSTAGQALTVTCDMTSSGGDCAEGTGTGGALTAGGSGGCSLIQ